jgi:RNA polymerase sigma-70 factor (ECF subfamily)
MMDLPLEHLQALIELLPEGARLIFNLFALEGFSHAEIAKSLSITEGASRAQLARARQILRERFAESNSLNQKAV